MTRGAPGHQRQYHELRVLHPLMPVGRWKTHAHTPSLTHMYTLICSQKLAETYICTLMYTVTALRYANPRSQRCMHASTLKLANTHVHTQILAHRNPQIHTHTHQHSCMHTRARTHTHTHTLLRSFLLHCSVASILFHPPPSFPAGLRSPRPPPPGAEARAE